MPSTSEERLARAIDDLAARLPVHPRWIASLLARVYQARIRFTQTGAIVVMDDQGQPFQGSDPVMQLIDEIMREGGPDGRAVPDEYRGEPKLGAAYYDAVRAQARAEMEQKGYARK